MRIQSYPRVCGCYYTEVIDGHLKRNYLAQVKLDAHTTVLSTAAKTVLKQRFVNYSMSTFSLDRENNEHSTSIDEIRYAFPLFDGVSIVSFKCKVGERTIFGLVKEKAEAKRTYEAAKDRGENAALLEQLPDMADIFTTSVSNIPRNASVEVTIEYIQELKHDSEVDGVRLTIPTHIAGRYGSFPSIEFFPTRVDDSGISIIVDINMAVGVPIKRILSPSHPVEISLGTLSTSPSGADFSPSNASVALALGTTQLEKDFVLQIVANDIGIPQAILETHPTLPNQRVVMTTLVPKFHLRTHKCEIIFILDRSGSMTVKMRTLISAMKVFLKSLPLNCMFNICSFGFKYEFLWPISQLYTEKTLDDAVAYVDRLDASFGGTETLDAVQAAFQGRIKALPTEIMLLTDGDISAQQPMFDFLEEKTRSGEVRVFPIGIGNDVSSAFIEGVARAGRGFAQMVGNGEKFESKIVRMIKGAITPHINDFQLEVEYDDGSVDSVANSLRELTINDWENAKHQDPPQQEVISLYDPEVSDKNTESREPNSQDLQDRILKIDQPKILQAPSKIPALFPFSRTCVYLILSPQVAHLIPKAVMLNGTSPAGPLKLKIPIQARNRPDEMLHQLAARKATQDLEEGRGWVSEIQIVSGSHSKQLLRDVESIDYAALQKRKAVRLGVEFQVGGKYCSFVAVEASETEFAKKRKQAIERSIGSNLNDDNDWDMIEAEEIARASVDQLDGRPRFSTGGQAPRMQLASRAATGNYPPTVRFSSGGRSGGVGGVRGGGRGGGRGTDLGLGRGGAMRHRQIPKSTSPPVTSSKKLKIEIATASNTRVTYDKQHSGKAAKTENADEDLTDEQIVQRLIEKQNWAGPWGEWHGLPLFAKKNSIKVEKEEFAEMFQASVTRMEDKKKRKIQGTVTQVLVTAVVVTFLEQHMTDLEGIWELVVQKARDWLDGNVDEKILEQAWSDAKRLVLEGK